MAMLTFEGQLLCNIINTWSVCPHVSVLTHVMNMSVLPYSHYFNPRPLKRT